MPIKQMTLIILVLCGICPGLCAQQNNGLSICMGLPLSAGFIVAQKEGIQAGVYGAGLGLYSHRKYANNMFVFAGIQVNYQKIHNYRNHVTYTSNWVNGTEQTKVELNTNINQFFIKVPLVLGYQLSKSFYAGAGLEFVSLIVSRITQEARGYYVEENYPDDGEILTATIKYEYKIDDEKNNAVFPRFNVAPCLAAGYNLSKSFSVQYMIAYDLLSSPVVESRFNHYNLLRNQIVLTFNLKSYEKFN